MNDYASWLDASTHAAIANGPTLTDRSIRAETLRALYRAGVLPETTPTLLADAVAALKYSLRYATPKGKLGR